ncbi:unnamed protein product [Camellia sinensis]
MLNQFIPPTPPYLRQISSNLEFPVPTFNSALYAVPKVPFPNTSAEALNKSSKSQNLDAAAALPKKTNFFAPPLLISPFAFAAAECPPPFSIFPIGFSVSLGNGSVSGFLIVAMSIELVFLLLFFRHKKSKIRRIKRNDSTDPIIIPAMAPPDNSFFVVLVLIIVGVDLGAGSYRGSGVAGARIEWAATQ